MNPSAIWSGPVVCVWSLEEGFLAVGRVEGYEARLTDAAILEAEGVVNLTVSAVYPDGSITGEGMDALDGSTSYVGLDGQVENRTADGSRGTVVLRAAEDVVFSWSCPGTPPDSAETVALRSAAARAYEDAVARLNADYESFLDDLEGINNGLPDDEEEWTAYDRTVFIDRFIASTGELGSSVERFADEARAIEFGSAPIYSLVDQLLEHVADLATLLRSAPQLRERVIAGELGLDGWLLAWLDISGLAWSDAESLRTALELPETAIPFNAAPRPTASPTPPPTVERPCGTVHPVAGVEGRLTYRSPHGTICVADLAAGTVRQVYPAHGAPVDLLREPTWMPDGQSVLAVRRLDEGIGDDELVTIEPDGRLGRFAWVEGLRFDDPAWSPDGSRIAMSVEVDWPPELYLVSADGSDWESLARRTPFDGVTHPTWSPDGKSLAFVGTKRTDGQLDESVHVLDLASGGTTRRVTSGLYVASPSWSPDGRWIAFEAYEPDQAIASIYLAHPDGTYPHEIIASEWEDNLHPTWSPDGRWLAFLRQETFGETASIWIAEADGANPRLVIEEATQSQQSADRGMSLDWARTSTGALIPTPPPTDADRAQP